MWLMIIGVFVVIYFFMWRPQKKRDKQEAAERAALQVGDEITTIGGIIGKVISIKEDTFVLETTKDKTKIRFLRGAIRSIDVKIADVAAAQAAEMAAMVGSSLPEGGDAASSDAGNAEGAENAAADAPATEEKKSKKKK